ncbi:MAG: hypothetical protein PHU91_00990 [Candidatus Omnitrophica bacterium]|nr:hypothetical protein [Candidatus Omnitrophota bacterium]MDD5236235.1 hypothetical protein [Candidatus Omnitrophota bacterium]MDD5610058.1 hypothetical protein [Candidatus Omnitrophota bacterium]
MFIHAVHFRVQPKEVADYRKDSLMWARQAKKYPGFLGYYTLSRHGHKHEFVSVYHWQKKAQCDRFMKELHEELVSKSKAKVTVFGYYNLTAIDKAK